MRLPQGMRPEDPLWLDGRIVEAGTATACVMSHSLHFAGSVFEGIRVYGGRPFALDAHMQRLERSADIIGYALPWSVEALSRAVSELVGQAGIAEGYVRPLAWRGSESASVTAQGTSVHVAIAAYPWPAYFEGRSNGPGLRLAVARWRRPHPDTAPVHAKTSGLYTIATMARDEARAGGFDDALLPDWQGDVAEATGANIVLVQGEQLVTPSPECFLDGITRREVQGLASGMGLEVEERRVGFHELPGMDAAFLCGTAVEVAAVASIGKLELGGSAIVEQLAQAYRAHVRA